MDELVRLSNENLGRLPSNVKTLNYDRSGLKPGMVHIGLGNFHRAHQAWYLHRLMEVGLCHDWAIIGAGVRPNDNAQRERLLAQDCLTTLIELDPSGKSAEVTGSMIDFLPVEEGNGALIARMAEPDIRIVSLTITEGGYYIDAATGGFDLSHSDIQHDLANPDKPMTVFGAMIVAFKRRRDNNHSAFTGLSCDNLQGNGAILRRTILTMAEQLDPTLARWIDDKASFPNSMVDCIVPATGENELALVRGFGVLDHAPVTHENFRQWVIEDDFCAERPDWDKVGATFAKDVHDYEAMKLRVLNGGHQMIALPADLLGIETISGSMAHKDIQAFLKKTIELEVAPNVTPVPGMTPIQYLDLVCSRFSNAEIVDTTRRVAFDGSSRQPGFIIPSIRYALDNGQPVDGLALMSAIWAYYCTGKREDGSTIEPNDPHWDALNEAALKAQSNPISWLQQREYYGDLADNEVFTASFDIWFKRIASDGLEAALRAFSA